MHRLMLWSWKSRWCPMVSLGTPCLHCCPFLRVSVQQWMEEGSIQNPKKRLIAVWVFSLVDEEIRNLSQAPHWFLLTSHHCPPYGCVKKGCLWGGTNGQICQNFMLEQQSYNRRSYIVFPVGGYLSDSNSPQVIHKVVIPLFLLEFEAALSFLLNHVRVLCDILDQFMPYIAAKDNCTGGRGGGVTEPSSSKRQVKTQRLYSILGTVSP